MPSSLKNLLSITSTVGMKISKMSERPCAVWLKMHASCNQIASSQILRLKICVYQAHKMRAVLYSITPALNKVGARQVHPFCLRTSATQC